MDSENIESLFSSATKKEPFGYSLVFAALFGTQVFFNCVVDTSGKCKLLTHLVGPLQHVVKFYTANTNYNLAKPFAGIGWNDGLTMFLKMAEPDGLLIMNEREDYVVFSRDAVQAALRKKAKA